MNKEEYVKLLMEATQALKGAPRDDSDAMAAWKPPMRLEDRVDFWREDHLFDDTGESVVINGQKVALVSLPADYLAIEGDSLEDMFEIAGYELEYIENQLPDEGEYAFAWSDEEEERRLNLKALVHKIKAIWRQIKQFFQKSMTVHLKEIKTGTLEEFQKSWRAALNQLVKLITDGVKDILTAATLPISSAAEWAKVGDWVAATGGKLPGIIKAIPTMLKVLIRTLMRPFVKLWKAFVGLGVVKNLASLMGFSSDDAKNIVKEIVDWIQSATIRTAAREIWDTHQLERRIGTGVDHAAKKVGGKNAPLTPAQQVHLKEGLTDIQDTLSQVNVPVTVIGLAAQGVGLLGGPVITAIGLPMGALVLGGIVVIGVMVLAALGADALRDEPRPGRYAGIALLAEKKLKNLHNV